MREMALCPLRFRVQTAYLLVFQLKNPIQTRDEGGYKNASFHRLDQMCQVGKLGQRSSERPLGDIFLLDVLVQFHLKSCQMCIQQVLTRTGWPGR